MDCEICLEPFDLTGKRPKSLPCAHNTFCLACLGRLQTPSCPMCRTEFTRAASLPDNFSLMRVLELQLANRSEPSIVPTAPPLEPTTSAATQEDDWWCVDCETVAGALCREKHFALRLEAVKPGKEDKAQQDASSVTLRDDWTRDWWCVECQAVAKDVCRDEHLVLRHKAAQLRREEEVATRPTSSKNENLGIKRRSSPSSDSSRLSMNLENLHLKDKKTCEACKEPIIGAVRLYLNIHKVYIKSNLVS
ncbi:uncharacterized protein LOC117640366 isoform X2 [Thrips palmi]|uniref:Uncharacterized protein LOC117640366 isoform X2 n=1 Tax=Thrips palmi TaxID=161013 RepID=A0A6P8YFN0_THRPL|nr:uncharacterized protein LOC117640366 isoform X2 [Thrips palmi]